MNKIIWNEIKLNSNDTGFIYNNKAIFNSYKRAMSFHEEGLAAVSDQTGAYHINLDGKTIYKKRYLETFGFYGGIATVRDKNGYFHIDTKGNRIHNNNFIWSGNFQENYCVVQNKDGFFHIDINGNRVYQEKYKYVGDFKYGISVVTNFNDKMFHIDIFGKPINSNKYFNAGVYHKGYAVVMDKDGYYHVDKNGKSLYEYRFKKLEVFYNGWALGEEKSGKKIRISENGFKVYLKEKEQILNSKDIIKLIKNGKRIGLFFRHSERYDGVNALIGEKILLTENGKKMALRLGEKLKDIKSVTFYSSPIKRCVQTVKEISNGMKANKEIIKSKMLGDPGVYFDYNSKINCGVAMEKEGFHNYVENYFQNGVAEGSIPLSVASEKLQIFIKENMKSSLTFFNSHDFLVASFMRYSGVKYPTKNDFVDYLEGILCLIDKDKKIIFYQFKDDITISNKKDLENENE